MNEAVMSQPTLLELWQRHVLECPHCGRARTPEELCQMGSNFWRQPPFMKVEYPTTAPVDVIIPPQVTQFPVPVQPHPQFHQPIQPVVQPTVQVAVQVQAPPAQMDLGTLASRVAERVIARSSTGAAIAVPMEKTSKLIDIHTAPGVTLRMPERDINVYSKMRVMIGKLLRHAERLGTYMLAMEETKKMSREAGITVGEKEMALVVSHVSERRGVGALSLSTLYDEFVEMTSNVVAIGDEMGRFMGIDADTRAVMKECRTLGIEMQGQNERAAGGELVIDNEMREIVRGMRRLAVSLQGEMDRRLGT